MPAELLSALNRRLPCRRAQIEKLYNLFAYKDEPYIEALFIHGGHSSGKSIVVTSLLESLRVKHCIVNILECYSGKILFETILNKLTRHQLDPRNPQPYAKCDHMMDFICYLQKAAEIQDFSGFVLVLDKAEELRCMDYNLRKGFLRLKELSGVAITVVLLSEIIFEKYLDKKDDKVPIKICFPQYNKDELLEILSLDIDNARYLIKETYHQDLDFDINFYKNYLNMFLSVFYRCCRDLSELRRLSRTNFVKYCNPVINKEHALTNSMALWRNIAPTLKASLEVLYLRLDSTTLDAKQTHSLENNAQSLELPFYAKYLLIAAYLASYNSAKDDKRLFMKYHGKKTKRLQDVKRKSKVSEQLNTQLGPKPFTLDRLLAIFYSLLDDKVGFNNNLLVQVSSLVELRLLSTATDNWTVDGQKYRCNVNFDFIHSISRMVGLNVRKYLSDFSHL